VDGCARLGWDTDVTPVNSGGREHYCGRCNLGCASQGKRGPPVSWLPAAAAAGARFVEGFAVERVVLETDAEGKRVARGVVGTWTSRDARGGVDGPWDERVV